MTMTTSRQERYSTRTIDIIVHGATGFTGKRVVTHLAKHHPELNVAVCGRSQDKLTAVANSVGWNESKCKSSIFVVSDIVNENDKLVAAFANAKVVIACAGPYRQCGLPILKAAVEARADYLDLCGEPQFFDDALLSFDREARSVGVLACHAAAFDCVPAELGAALAERELLKNNTSCAGVEVIHTMQNVSCANATTWHAAVDGFHAAASGELAKSRQKVKENYPEFKETMPPSRPAEWAKAPVAPGLLPGYNEELELRTMKFVGADSSAIRCSWRYLRSRKPDHPRKGTSIPEPKLSVLIGMDSKDSMSALKVMGFGATFSFLARYKWGCDMLHANPEGFSGGVFKTEGPTQEELEKGRFTTYVTAFGPNNNDRRARVKVSGPEPGYVATPILIVSLALTILDTGKADAGNDLSFDAGVTLPGALFGDSEKVYEHMRNEGVNFDVVDEFDDSQSPV
ncbi:saccharopine dehydrogenase family protein [Skeletonema marinoi]|uniref:Saccharopine dehydrogenase family protein n=1 Tax=Skeletonema marinoi TaxID=267567 RepID=A0AAD8Y990_9STRA|nr:saccharopine dehydrogenase family protein [Skeletonema marinoi]